MRNHCYDNDFDLHENETACRTHFHMKGFVLRLILKQRHKRSKPFVSANFDNYFFPGGGDLDIFFRKC